MKTRTAKLNAIMRQRVAVKNKIDALAAAADILEDEGDKAGSNKLWGVVVRKQLHLRDLMLQWDAEYNRVMLPYTQQTQTETGKAA